MASIAKLNGGENWLRQRLGISSKIISTKRPWLNMTLTEVKDKLRPYAGEIATTAALVAGGLAGMPVLGTVQEVFPGFAEKEGEEFELKGVPVTNKTIIGKALVINPGRSERRAADGLVIMAVEKDRSLAEVIAEEQALAIKIFDNVVKSFTENKIKLGERERKELIDIRTLLLKVIAEDKLGVRDAIAKMTVILSGEEREGLTIRHKVLANILSSRMLIAAEIAVELEKIGQDERIAFVAEDLDLSDMWLIDDRRIRGIVREKGNPADHVSGYIIRHEKAGLVAVANAPQKIAPEATVIIDGWRGKIIVNPSQKTIDKYVKAIEVQKQLDLGLKKLREVDKLFTHDGKEVELRAAIEKPEQIDELRKHGFKNFSIVRTEFFFSTKMDGPKPVERRKEPEIDEWIKFSQSIIDKAGGDEVLFRTIDPAEDKAAPFFDQKHLYEADGLPYLAEGNPYNFSFQLQLEALLRTRGKIKVLFPSIRTEDDFKTAMSYVNKVKKILQNVSGLAINEEIKFGAMVENRDIIDRLPYLVKHPDLDFMVIGPKDLTQSITFTSRHDTETAAFFDHLHPDVVKAMKTAIDISRNNDKEIYVCEGMRDEWEWLLVLLGLGFRTIDVSSGFVDRARAIIGGMDSYSLRIMVESGISNISTAEEFRHFIREYAHHMLTPNQDGKIKWEYFKGLEYIFFPEF
jgi:phosphoenolpyruvate-protein kinase (PTS system EI component)